MVEPVARRILALSCLGSAGIHVALVPGHAATAPVLAAAFLTAAAGLGLAALLALAGRDAAAGSIALLGALVAAYVVDRTLGLPLGPEHGHTHEGVDALGLGTKALELVGLAAALALLRVRRSRPFRHERGTGAIRPAA